MKFSLFLGAMLWCCTATVSAQHAGHHGATAPPASFIASSDRPYASLADDAMAIMDDRMRRAPTTGDPAHDFMSMMIPHHQGAIDMAKAILVHSNDRELRNLAQGIVVEQQNEINVMRAWLQRYQAAHGASADTTNANTRKDSHATH